jgi:PA domain
MMRSRLLCLELLWICSFLSPLLVSGATKTNTLQAIADITNWRVFPQRHRDEAAVIEWGHSAIISAIDASVAHFGPQTSQAALFEVETTPVLADPINGKVDDANGALVNADQMHGNVVVMTDTDRSCLDLALTAQRAQAAALIVVHVNEARPDDAPRCAIPPGRATEAATIDIPVVTISLASVDVLTMATVTEDMQPEEVVNHGMPER